MRSACFVPAFLLFASFSCGGCAMVSTAFPDGTESVRLEPLGFFNSPGDRGAAPRWMKVDALGVSSTPLGVNLGFSRAEIVTAPPGCSAVVVVRDAPPPKLGRLLSEVDDRCVIRTD